MSLGCLLYLRWHQWGGGLWPGFPTHSPSWESARKRGQGAHHRAPGQEHPGAERVYKRRNTDGSSVSVVSHQQLSSGMFAVIIQVEWRNRGSEDWYEGWRITLYGVWTPPCEYARRVELLSMKRRHQSMKLLTEMNFEVGFIKTKHSYHGTLQIMEHLVSVDSRSVLYSVILLVVCIFPCISY